MFPEIDDSDFRRGNLLMMATALFVGLLIFMAVPGCEDGEGEKILSASFFEGEHQILPIGGNEENGFLSFDPKYKEYCFYWQNNNNNYSGFFFINQSMVRFEYDESYEAPVLRFRWRSKPANKEGQAVMIESQWRLHVIYIVIRGKAEHLNVKPAETI